MFSKNTGSKSKMKYEDEVDILRVVNLPSSALKMYVIVNVKCSQ